MLHALGLEGVGAKVSPREREAPPGTLAEKLRAVHRVVDEGLARVAVLASECRYRDARDQLTRCVALWERGVRLEEELLYPLFELRLGTAGAGTAAMRDEHRDLRRSFESLAVALEAGRHQPVRDALELLAGGLGSHFSREERVVYPTLDAMLSDSERGRLLTRVEDHPAGRAEAAAPQERGA